AGVLSAAPVLSVVSQAASNITTAGATITWTTNVPSDSLVQYGLTTLYGAATTLDPAMTASHSALLTGLQPGTTYNYRVLSHDSAGNTAMSDNHTFATLALSRAGSPSLPSVSVDTTMPSTTGAVYTVAAGADI